jgi:dTDP-4-dehydrorhamnose reductase
MTAPGRILVVGGDGRIGAALCRYLRGAGETVSATTRRQDAPEGSVFLDLGEDPGTWTLPPDVRAAVLCAAASGIDRCENDPAATARINVEAVCDLAARLPQAAFMVFLSTSQVFDGSLAFPEPDAPVSPPTQYGRQKALAEGRLLAEFPSRVAVLRLTKVFDARGALAAGWTRALLRGEPVEPFSDMVFSPVPLSSVAACVRLLLDRRCAGVFHWSGERDVSYTDFALALARRLGAEPGLVRPVSAAKQGKWAGPPRTALGMKRTKDVLGVAPPEVAWTLASESEYAGGDEVSC